MRRPLLRSGFGVSAGGQLVETRPEQEVAVKVIAGLVASVGFDLPNMGANGHSRMRALVIGSPTTEMIRSCKIPIMLFR